MRRLWTAAGLASLALLSCGGSGGSGAYSGHVLSFGAILSLTGPGGVYGIGSKNGINLALTQINDRGGVLGARINVQIEDDGSIRATSTADLNSLLATKPAPLALLGPTLSNSAVAVQPLANRAGVPIIGISDTGNHLVPDCNYPDPTPCPYVFRDSLGEAAAIPASIAAWQAAHHARTGVLLVASDDKFSADGGAIVSAIAPQYGIQLLGTIDFSKNASDLGPYVRQALALKPEVIFITSLGNLPAEIMVQARALGFQGEFLGGNGFNTAQVSAQAGPAGLGAQSGSAWYLGNASPANRAFVSAYQTAYGQDPDQFAAQGYAAVQILAQAASRAHLRFTDPAQDRNRLRTALAGVDVQTPLGRFRFTSAHDVRQTIWLIQMDGKGGFKLVGSAPPV
ncbi:MAG TPA: ABC transporter substrate-binding protein [Candidatus Nitrosotalea sp.]|nr:ABC transporter substrate-binding protein [Candidatus Nitrosotalea sp.]